MAEPLEREAKMILEKKSLQVLNFLNTQRSWVYRTIRGNEDQLEVISLSQIPKGTGEYWLAGETSLKSGRKLESVFVIDTDSGGTVRDVHWKIGDQWYHQQDDDTVSALGGDEKAIFPYDWSYAIPLEEDLFH